MWLSRKLGLDNKPHFCYNEYNKTRKVNKMKIINSVITVQLTGIDQATLSNAYTILNELYKIIDENDCKCATDSLTHESCDKGNIALAANILRTFASTDKLEISK